MDIFSLINSLRNSIQPHQAQPTKTQIAELNALRNNVMAQTAYTPQARAYLMGVPLTVSTNPNAGGDYSRQTKAIAINPSELTPNNPNAVTTLRHEYLHALDNHAGNFLSPYGLSNNYFNNLPAESSPNIQSQGWVNNQMSQPLYANHNLGFGNNQSSVEGFAYGGQQGQNALLSPMGNYYRSVYTPVSTAPLNYSPIYPSPETQLQNTPRVQMPTMGIQPNMLQNLLQGVRK